MTDESHDAEKTTDAQDEFVVLPPEGDVIKLPPPPPIAAADDEASHTGQQFSLAGMFVLMLLGAAVSVVASYVSLRVFTGIMGLLSLLTLGLLSMIRPRTALAHVAWWLLLGLYLMAAGIAVVRGE